MKVQISKITLADDINIRQELRQEAVDRYAEILDEMPPVQLWRPDGNGKLLLVDGWHRVAAASQLGRVEIEAEVHEGDRTEAMVAAIIANTKHGVPLSTSERNRAIGRLGGAGWSFRRIAKELGLDEKRIRQIVEAAEVPPHLPHREEAIRAPREYRLPVAEAASAGGWSQRETREVAQQLASKSIPEADKQAIVQRYLVTREDGQVGVPAQLVAAVLREASIRSAAPAIYGFTAAAAELLQKLRVDDDPLEGISPTEYPDIIRGLSDAAEAIKQVGELLEAAMVAMKR